MDVRVDDGPTCQVVQPSGQLDLETAPKSRAAPDVRDALPVYDSVESACR